MKTIYVFGNEFLDCDNLALKVADKLKDFKVVKCRSPDELLEISEDNEIIILDVIKNSNKTILINDISKLKVNSLVSMHDFDVGYFLNLMQSLGLGLKVKIIGIPQEGDFEKIVYDVKRMMDE